MMRVAVVDDEPLARRGVIARLLEQADTEVCGEYGDGAAALSGLQTQSPDVVFMDVQMPDANGLDVLNALAPDCRLLAILLTAYDGFAVRAFELNAIDYLLKPIDDARFAEALDRARNALGRPRSPAPASGAGNLASRLEVTIGRRTAFVDIDDITWIGADGDYAMLHTDNGVYPLRMSLHQLCRCLDPARFVRVHRSAIVRIDCVGELQPLSNRDAMLRLRDGTPVRASRTHIDALLAALRGHPADTENGTAHA